LIENFVFSILFPFVFDVFYNWIGPAFPLHGSTSPEWDIGSTYVNPYIVEKL